MRKKRLKKVSEVSSFGARRIMGCFSSKLLFPDDHDRRNAAVKRRRRRDLGREPADHVVSLTSSTYGVLNLDPVETKPTMEVGEGARGWRKSPPPSFVSPELEKKVEEEPSPPSAEMIDARELMGDLVDETPRWSPTKKQSKFLTPVAAVFRTPVGACRAATSPRKQKRRLFYCKENDSPNPESSVLNRDQTLKPSSLSIPKSATPKSAIRRRSSPVDAKFPKSPKSSPIFPGKENDSPNPESSVLDHDRTLNLKPSTPSMAKFATPKLAICSRSSPKKSKSQNLIPNSSLESKISGPLFDPDLIASFEKENTRKARESLLLLSSLKPKCPPGGEETVILYTTTLRGIRKTFEDCNAVRAAIQSHGVRFVERDVSMDSGFREQLKVLMQEVRVPRLFVKGRLVGGAEEVRKMEEEGDLGVLLEGMPRAGLGSCRSCGGARFVMCGACRGSCRVAGEDGRRTARCGECNENGLRRCEKCC